MAQVIIEADNTIYSVAISITDKGQTILSTLECLVCREFRITESDFKSNARYLPLPRARGTFTRILRSRFDIPLKIIGMYLGGRDHSTILMSEQRSKEFYKKNERYRATYDLLEKDFQLFLAKNRTYS